MPWWPIMMPSEAVGAPKICGTPPAARMPSQPLRASRSRWELHGVMSLNSEATPIIGRSKSSSRKPTARNIARLGARPIPPVVRRLRLSFFCDMMAVLVLVLLRDDPFTLEPHDEFPAALCPERVLPIRGRRRWSHYGMNLLARHPFGDLREPLRRRFLRHENPRCRAQNENEHDSQGTTPKSFWNFA